jgi:hypothetical protein
MKALVIVFAVFLLSCLLFTNTSCQKKTDCVALVNCVDSSGAGINNVNVQLYATVKTANGGTVIADVKANGNTDGSGKVKFTFKLPAIYDIKATVAVGTNTYVGSGIIKLEAGTTVDKTVTMH